MSPTESYHRDLGHTPQRMGCARLVRPYTPGGTTWVASGCMWTECSCGAVFDESGSYFLTEYPKDGKVALA